MRRSFENQVEELLSEELSTLLAREKKAFDLRATPFEESLVLFGAGNLGRKTLRGLRQVGIEPLAFADNNSELWNNSVDGLIVLPPQEAARKFGERAAFVVTIWGAGSTHRLGHTRQQLHALKCTRVVSFAFLFWKYPEVFLPYYCIESPHKFIEQFDQIPSAFRLWADESSRHEFLAQLRFRFWLDFDFLPGISPGNQYFPDDLFRLSSDEVFVDCGAFDGDTIKTFLKRQECSFKQIVALEPDPLSFQNLRNYISMLEANIREKISVMPLAAGTSKGKAQFDGSGLPSAAISDKGTTEVDVAPLDKILKDVSPTYMKMDIEGAEPEALLGACRIIHNASPILAISVYHRFEHIWSIPLLILSLSGRYRFFLRAHGEEGWDLVCYAVPHERVIAKIKL